MIVFSGKKVWVTGLSLLCFIFIFVLSWGNSSKASNHQDCTGTIQWVFTNIDGTQYFSLEPQGRCRCWNDQLDGKGFVNLPNQFNHLQNYKNALSGLISGKSVTVLFEWPEKFKKGGRCKVIEIGI